MNETKTIGDLMNDQRRNAMRGLSLVMALVLYGAVILYTGVHNFNLFRRTLPADQQLFAALVLLCLEGAAVFLPLAIHFWLAPGPQRTVGYIWYALNFGLVIGNTILDSMLNLSQTIPDWLQVYANFVAPATPIFIGVGVALMLLLDPSKKIHDAMASAQAATIDATAVQMREMANNPEVNAMVTTAAHRNMLQVVGATSGQNWFGNALPGVQSKPAQTVQFAAQPPVAVLQDSEGDEIDRAAQAAGVDRETAERLIAALQQDPKATARKGRGQTKA